MRHLKRLEQGMRIQIPTDENGLAGRECPVEECQGYFKIKFGTGLKGENLPCHCPYCGHTGGQDQFWTQDQVKYARSVALGEINKALKEDVKEWDRKLRQGTRNSFIKLSMEFKGRSHPIQYYGEKELETQVECSACTLEYAVYGLFAFCPDCGTHNSPQILLKNLEFTEKLLAKASQESDTELSEFLTASALEAAVSTFDGFGHAYCEAYSSQTMNSELAKNISFQNISKARSSFATYYGKDFAQNLTEDEWTFVLRCFQKRHLFAHKMGVIDKVYVELSKDPTAVVGRKVKISIEEVRKLLPLLAKMGEQF